MDCVPPTLSGKNRCTGIMNNSKVYDFLEKDYYKKYLLPKKKYKPNPAELKCKKPCQLMENRVHLVESTPIDVNVEKPTITLRFLESVEVKTKVRLSLSQISLKINQLSLTFRFTNQQCWRSGSTDPDPPIFTRIQIRNNFMRISYLRILNIPYILICKLS
jgi:hypothetical protein